MRKKRNEEGPGSRHKREAVFHRYGLAIAYSRVNQAWLVLWGIGDLEGRCVLRIFNDRSEAEDYVKDLRRQ